MSRLFALLCGVYGRLLPRAIRDEVVRDLREELTERRARGARASALLGQIVRDVLTTDYMALHRTARAIERRRRSWDGGGGTMFDLATWGGIRHAWRALRRAPGFTALAVGTIALSVGGASTIGGVLGSVLLRPLPFAQADRLVTVRQMPEGSSDRVNASAPLYARWHDGLGLFDAVAAYRGPGWTMITSGPRPERVPSVRVTADYFPALGVAPVLGRAFTEADAVGEAEAVIVSWSLWNRLGRSPDDIGTTVSLDEAQRVVVGVMPPGFEFVERGVDVWWPYRPEASAGWGEWTMKVFARLAPGVTAAEAEASLRELQTSLREEDPSRDILPTISVRSLSDEIVGGVRLGLIATALGGALALLIASVNIGGLLLSRNIARRPELAMMQALGAGKRRIAVHLAAQGAMLTGAGVALGIAIAWGLLEATRGILPADFPRLQEVTLNGYTIAAAALSAVVVSVAAGLLAIPWRDTGLPGRLRPERGHGHALSGILVAQISLTAVLLVAGALLGRSFLGLTRRDPGIDPAAVLAVELRLPASLAEDPEAARSFVREVDRSVAALPAVTSVGQIQRLPFAGGNWSSLVFDPEAPVPEPPPESDVRVVTPGYMTTVRLPLLRGRGLTEQDRADGSAVVLVNEVLADAIWPGEDPLGQRLVVDMFDRTGRLVVGVVGSVRHHGLTADPQPEVYVPYDQTPVAFSTLVVRGPGGPQLVEDVRRTVQSVRASASVSRPTMLEEFVDASIATERMYAFVFGALSALALVLSGIGVFGVASFRVAQEHHQLGLRAALGASPGRLRVRILRRAALVVGFGLALGLLASRFVRGALGSLLFGIPETDATSYVLVTAVLAGLGIAASLLPALRAGRTDPMTAIRQ